jgi:hypothetical protein
MDDSGGSEFVRDDDARAPMWPGLLLAGVYVYVSLNFFDVFCLLQGQECTVVGVGVVWTLLCRGVLVSEVHMWAARAAVDHSSARVHDVIAEHAP